MPFEGCHSYTTPVDETNDRGQDRPHNTGEKGMLVKLEVHTLKVEVASESWIRRIREIRAPIYQLLNL